MGRGGDKEMSWKERRGGREKEEGGKEYERRVDGIVIRKLCKKNYLQQE